MIEGLVALLSCQLAGEATVRWLALPLPGPVLGMMYLIAALALRARFGGRDDVAGPDSPVGHVSDVLIANMGVLFVPAGVGIVQYLGMLGQNWLALTVAVIASTLLALIVTVGAFVLVRRVLGDFDLGQEDREEVE